MHRVLRAAEFAWGPKAAYEVTFLGCTSRFVRMNQYDVESSVQPPYKVSFTGEAFPPLAQMVLITGPNHTKPTKGFCRPAPWPDTQTGHKKSDNK